MQDISAKEERMKAIHDAAGENDLTTEQETEWNTLRSEVVSLKKKVERAQFAEAQEERDAQKIANQRKRDKRGGGEEAEKAKLMKDYSFVKLIRSQMPNGRLDGIEAEMHQEGIKEARSHGLEPEGVTVPSYFMEVQKRDLVVGTDTAGGHTVATDLRGFIPALRPKLRVIDLGATVLNNLRGNLDIMKQTGVTAAVWEGEQDANAESEPTFNKISLTPKRLGAFTEVGKQLIAQSSLAVENLVRRDLEIAVGTKLDLTAINGTGTAPEPEGILNVTGIGSVPIATDGGAPTRTHLINLWKEIAQDNADVANMGYLTTPGVKAKLMDTAIDAGSGRFVWEDGLGLLGYQALTSTQVPSNLTKGSGTNLHAIIFGNWNDLIIGNWAGIDLVVDPYTRAKEATIQLVINSWWDLAVRHAESFAAVVDADVS